MTLKEKLVTLRKENGFSQEELAEKLGVSRQTISKWERGEASPDINNAIQLTKIYSISLDEIASCITGEEMPKHRGISLKKESYKSAAESNATGNEYIRMVIPEKETEEIYPNLKKSVPPEKKTEEVYPQLNAYTAVKPEEKISEAKPRTEEKTYRSVKMNTFGGYNSVDKREAIGRKLMKFPFWALAVLIFLFFGGVCRLWGYSWIIFLLVPVYYTTIKAWVKRNAFYFLYPLFAAAAFSFAVMFFNAGDEMAGFLAIWAFGSIPLYYTAILAYRKKKCKFFCFPALVAILFLSGAIVFSSPEPFLWLFALIPFYYIYSSKIDERIFGGKK